MELKYGDIITCLESYGQLVQEREYIFKKYDYDDYITIEDTITGKIIEGYNQKRFIKK